MKKSIIVSIFLFLFIFSASFPIFAASYDLKQITPQIQRAIDSRAARFQALQRLKSEGLVGEDNQGFVRSLRENAEADHLTGEENHDRKVIYEAIVEQNQLGASGLITVKRTFAEVQREKARTGDIIQSPSGDWTRK